MKRLILFIICLILSVSAAAAQTVNVRGGIHDRYNRLVFDWDSTVKYDMQQTDGFVTIQFDKPATANFKQAMAANPPFIRNLQQQNAANGLQVTFQIPNGARVQAFPVGTKTAFDVLLMQKGQPVFADAKAPATASPSPAEAADEKPVAAPQAQIEEPKTQEVQSQETAVKPQDSVPVQPAAAAPSAQQFRTLADVLDNKPDEKALKQPDAAPAEIIHGTVIKLQPQQMTRFAAFERSGKLWLVLDQKINGLLPRVQGDNIAALQNVRRIDGERATAFVFDAPAPGTVYSVKRNGDEWQLWLNPEDKPYLPMQMPVTVDDDSVSLYAGEQPSVVPLKDSQLGDMLWVVTVRAPEARIVQPRRGSLYQLIPTLMGAAIIPSSDVVRITTANDLVLIKSAGSQNILTSDKKDRSTGGVDPKAPSLFRLDVPLQKAKNGDFQAKRQEVEKQISYEEDENKKAQRTIDLARLYLAEGFGQEAMGLLRIAVKEQPALENTPVYQALEGMAGALTSELNIAEYNFTLPDIQSQPLAKLWLGYAYADANKWVNARAAYIESGNAEDSLPDKLKTRVLLSKAETALVAGDVVTTQELLKKLDKFKLTRPNEIAGRDYIKAKLMVAANNAPKSIPLYEKLADSPDHLYRVKAELDLVKQQLAAKEIKLNSAIERLERLRFSWRGDRLEIMVLKDLGQYYIDDKKYMDGLALWRQAASLSRDAEDTDQITKQMQDVFKKLYVEGVSDELQPLQAVAIYERFRELTPTGEEGDVAIQRLADRLVSVDLLDQADVMLQNQLLKNSQGIQAVKVGTKLASIRVKNNDPAGVIKALDESNRSDVNDPQLDTKRILLRASALADQKKTDEALALLKDNNSQEALSLKADIAWRENRWPDALGALQSLVTSYRNQGKTTPDGPIPPLVMKMAISLALDDNKKGMELLVTEYGAFMAKTKQAESFNLITKTSRGSSLADLETLKNQVGEVELFSDFLKNF